MKAIIKNIEMQNFKGFASAKRDFDAEREVIKAKNGSGKSTFMYAFLWTVGLNVNDVIPKLFNKEIPDLVISVKVVLDIDGVEYVLIKEQKSVVKVNKETGESTKTSNESKYSIDGIAFTFTKYKEKLEQIFGNSYDCLEMLISKEFFNSETTKWKWDNRRKVLFNICKVDEVLNKLLDKPAYDLIATDVKKGYSTSDLKKSYRKEKNGYTDLQKRNTIIIEEKSKDVTTYSEYDFDKLEKEKKAVLNKITALQTATKIENKNTVLSEKTAEMSTLVTKLSKLQAKGLEEKSILQNRVYTKHMDLQKIKCEGDGLKRDIENNAFQAKRIENEIDKAKEQVYSGDVVCPTCGQALPEKQIDEAKQMWEDNRTRITKDLTKVLEETKALNVPLEKQVEELRNKYKELKAEYDINKEKLDTYNPNSEAIEKLQTEIGAIKAEISNLKVRDVKANTNEKTREFQDKLDFINNRLTYKNIISDIKTDISKKKNDNVDLADKIALCERKEKQLEEFVREQVSLVNETINSKFGNGVSFALYNELYRDGDGGLSETCICMLDGKTYTAMSTGERYKADLEVVKSLQREYGVKLPIFSDNAESFTDVITAKQQLIELYATKGKTIEDTVRIETIL